MSNSLKLFVSSLGCDKNLCDTEHMLGLLIEHGLTFTDIKEEADVILINTCAFIGDAKKESIAEIISLAKLKEEGNCKALIITGCLSERYQKEIQEELPEVDGALGIAAWDQIVNVVEGAMNGEKPFIFPDHNILCKQSVRVLTTGGHYAYLKIAEGCDKYCTYCAIPYIRGKYRSYPMEDLINEASELVAGGVKELILVAQETTLYGTDLYGKKCLPELLQKLSQFEDLKWIRVLYAYPEEIDDAFIAEMKRNPKVLHYLDMPIQHASDSILKAMNRHTTREELIAIIKKLRKEIPDICLRTTLITGFPGENEKDFNEQLKFVKMAKFERLGAFTYSKEEGTIAAKMKGQILQKVKKQRLKEIMILQQEISKAHGKKMIGKKLDCMIQGRIVDEEGVYIGRTYMDAPDVDGFIFIKSDIELLSGDFVRVKVVDYKEYDLIGEMV